MDSTPGKEETGRLMDRPEASLAMMRTSAVGLLVKRTTPR